MSDDVILRASEIGEYVFCQRAWWLQRVRGLESAHHPQMEVGVARHRQHGRAAQRADAFARAARGLAALALLCALLFVLAVGLR